MASILKKVASIVTKPFVPRTDARTRDERDKALNRRLDDMAQAAMGASKELHSMYQTALNYTYGNQWAGRELKGGYEPVVANYIYPAVMQELAVISQRHSTISALPWEDTDSQAADVWTGYFRHLYKRELKMNEWLLRAALDGKIYGHYVAYLYWEPRKEWDHGENKWRGGFELRLIHPEFFGSDPESDTVDNGEYIVTRRAIPREKANILWPEHKDAIDKFDADDQEHEWYMPGSLEMSSMAMPNAQGRDFSKNAALQSHQRLASLITGATSKQRGRNVGNTKKWITIEQFWFKDREMLNRPHLEKVPRETLLEQGFIREGSAEQLGIDILNDGSSNPLSDENHPTREKIAEVPRYPTYRYIARLGDRILNHKLEKQVWPYRRHPLIVGVNQFLPHVWWGLNATEMPKGMQDMTNMSMTHLMEYLKNFSDPQWIKEQGVLAKGEKLKAGSGNVITVKPNKLDKLKRLDAAAWSAGAQAAFEMAFRETQSQTGVHEVSTGRQSQSRATATEIVQLQTNTQMRMALSNMLLDGFTVRLFENIGEIAQRKLEPGEWIRIVGEKKAPTVTRITQEMGSVRYDVDLQVTTALPFDREKRRQEARELFTLIGIPALKELVETYGDIIGDPEDFMARVEAYQQILIMQQNTAAEVQAGLEAGEQAPA